MDLYIDRSELIAGLSRVQGIVERRTTNLSLAHVLLEADSDNLRMTATDTQLTLVADYPARVDTPGRLSVDAQTLFRIARSLSDSTVNLKQVGGERLRVSAGRACFNVMGATASEFPPIAKPDECEPLRVSGTGLRRCIEETLFSLSADDNRYGLNGAHLEESDSGEEPHIRMVTTDGSRLSWSQIPYQGTFGMGRSMLLPRKALGELRKMAGDADWEIAFGERTATFRTEGLALMVRLIEGDFPDYRQVLPRKQMRSVKLDRSQFLEALRHVAIMASDRHHSVHFSFEREQVVLSAQNIESGDVREEVPAELEGEPLLTGFNVRYFQDVLGATRDEVVTLGLGEALEPCLIRLGEREDCLFVVMPMRID